MHNQCILCPNCSRLYNTAQGKCTCGYMRVNIIITPEDYFKCYGRKSRHFGKDFRTIPAFASEYDQEVKENAEDLLIKVNALVQELGLEYKGLNSGWRPSLYNVRIGGARRSRHTIGQAIDLTDRDGKIKAKIMSNPEVLRPYDMSMEHPSATRTWCHLQTPPPRSGRLVFWP